MLKRRFGFLISALLLALLSAKEAAANPLDKIQHVVVIYMENRSFDNMLFGFPGTDDKPYAKQVDANGNELPNLSLPVIEGLGLPSSVPNAPFDLDKIYPRNKSVPSPTHRFYQNQFQIDRGKNDRFTLYSGDRVKGLTMGHHSNKHTALWRYAREYTLCDRFFMAAFGGSFLNHQWLVAAATPVYPGAPDNLKAVNVDNPKTFKDGLLTPDGHAVNTMMPEWPVPFAMHTPVLPPQDGTTIADRLTEKSVSWKWYSQGWNEALDDVNKAMNDENLHFEMHHMPLVYYKTCKVGTECFKNNLKDRDDFLKDVSANKLPSVSFYKPGDKFDQHPDAGTVDDGDAEIDLIVKKIKKSKAWKSTVIIVTYDENGGFWDHVPPPQGDEWGPGNRVPAVIISPFAKRGVDHTNYDTTSILKFIEKRFDLLPLGGERKSVGDLTNALK